MNKFVFRFVDDSRYIIERKIKLLLMILTLKNKFDGDTIFIGLTFFIISKSCQYKLQSAIVPLQK